MEGLPLNGAVIDEAVDLEDIVAPFEDTDDGKDHLTHLINPTRNLHIWRLGMTSKDVVALATLGGIVITALCGYTWVPTRNPDKYPVCKACMEVGAAMIAEKEG